MPSTYTGYKIATNTIKTDTNLQRVFHDLLAGVTGLNATLVRPRFQKLPPVIPEGDWLAFGITTLDDDTYPSTKMSDDGLSQTIRYNQDITVQITIYGDNAEGLYNLLNGGMLIEQNRSFLRDEGIVLHNSEFLSTSYEQLNNLWYKRCEVKMYFTRRVERTFEVQSLTGLVLDVKTN